VPLELKSLMPNQCRKIDLAVVIFQSRVQFLSGRMQLQKYLRIFNTRTYTK